mmetsp:Transcript_98924/g.317189  ORF Transcript_98924/g.317189 Transcript_98924/m.317189 type:complete len:217 (+) Transcript_98924:1129-1779(+)
MVTKHQAVRQGRGASPGRNRIMEGHGMNAFKSSSSCMSDSSKVSSPESDTDSTHPTVSAGRQNKKGSESAALVGKQGRTSKCSARWCDSGARSSDVDPAGERCVEPALHESRKLTSSAPCIAPAPRPAEAVAVARATALRSARRKGSSRAAAADSARAARARATFEQCPSSFQKASSLAHLPTASAKATTSAAITGQVARVEWKNWAGDIVEISTA